MNRAISALNKKPAIRAKLIEQVQSNCTEAEIHDASIKACKLLGLDAKYAELAQNQILRSQMDVEIQQLDNEIAQLEERKAKLVKEKASVDTVVTVVVMLLVAAILVPIALSLLANTTTTNWSATNITIFGLLGTVAMVAIILKFLRQVKET